MPSPSVASYVPDKYSPKKSNGLANDEHGVAAAEGKGIAHQDVKRARPGAGGHVIQIALGIEHAIIDRGRHDGVVQRLDATNDLQRGAGGDGMGEGTFVGGDGQGIGLLAKNTFEGGRLNFVV